MATSLWSNEVGVGSCVLPRSRYCFVGFAGDECRETSLVLLAECFGAEDAGDPLQRKQPSLAKASVAVLKVLKA